MNFNAPIRLRVLPAILPVDGREVELQATATHLQWRYVDDHNGTYGWADLIALSALAGPAGPGTEFRVDGEYIQFRSVGAAEWINLIAVADLTGPEGHGASAYEIAVANGFEGTEAEWLDSLNGQQGERGDPGDSGYPSITAASAITPEIAPDFLQVTGYATAGDGGGALYKKVASEPTHPGKFAISTEGGATFWYEIAVPEVRAEHFGAVGDNATNCTTAILNAIAFLKKYPKVNIDTIGGNDITMYASGRVNFGPGVFRVDKGALDIADSMGLTFVGAGSRGMTNALNSRTTLLITGTGSGFGIRAYRGGARSMAFRSIDVCYESSAFTGDLIDVFSAPYFSARDCYFGTFGNSGSTRFQSAQSLIRITYDEGAVIDRCVLDGAVRGIWFDEVRTDLGNVGFGGWGSKIKDTILYDFTEHHIVQLNSGTRVRSGLTLDNVNLNPINVAPSRALGLDIVRGLSMRGCSFVSSVAAAPTQEWARLKDVTGEVAANRFGVLANGMTIEGISAVDVVGNVFETQGLNHGLRLRGGSNTSRNNRYEAAANGILIQDDAVNVNHFVGGGDLFRPAVGSSINVVSASTLLSGHYDYEQNLDGSASKFSNANERVMIANKAGRHQTITVAAEVITRFMSGALIRAAGTADQVFTMTAPHPGTRFTIFKVSDRKLTINPPAGKGFYTGNGPRKTKIEIAAIDVGASIELEVFGTDGWRLVYSGTVTLT